MSEHHPDTTVQSGQVSTRRLYTGRVINLDVDTVRFPDGSTGDLEIIRHPGASAIVPILDDIGAPDPTLVLIKQYRYAGSGYLYEIPAGRLNPGEDPRDCALRELLEETGFRARTMEPLYTMFTTPGFTDERIHVFCASQLAQETAAREPDEFMSVEPMRLSAALALIESGVISDSKTALAILHLAQFGFDKR